MMTELNHAKGAFSSFTRFLKQNADCTFPTDYGRVTSLGPFGVRNAVAGLKVAPLSVPRRLGPLPLLDYKG